MPAIGFQLYSLHAVSDPLPDVLAATGKTAFEGVEFAGLGDTPPQDVAAALEAADLDVAGAHVGLDEIEANPQEVATTYRDLDCTDIVVPWLDPDHFESLDTVEAAGTRLAEAADTLVEYDCSLHYHNHDQEFVQFDGRPALDALLETADEVGLQLDLGWAGAAGYDPLPFLEERADRVRTAHLKDYDAATQELVEVGRGDLDIPATVELVRDLDLDWLVYEAEHHPDSYETLDHADDILEAYW